MSVKKRIFATYLFLLAIILVYIGISSLAGFMREQVEADRSAILELRKNWGTTRALLNDMVINWDNGAVYEDFRQTRLRFGAQLAAARDDAASRWYYPGDIARMMDNLRQVWDQANRHLDRVDAAVENSDFRLVNEAARKQPGLQRLNDLWDELQNRKTPEARRAAFLIQELIIQVEFFPIYSGPMERLFAVLAERSDSIRSSIVLLETSFRIVFFLSFLGACLLLASRFTNALSDPIISAARRLYEFAGLTGAASKTDARAKNADELEVLKRSVEQVIDHYTDLSHRASLLAEGRALDAALSFPREGIVGRSLDEIADYLRELARTSERITDGEYGLQLRQRSAQDVISRNFNLMSSVIDQTIGTLRSIFEAVDEAVLVIGENGKIEEANSQLYRMVGAEQDDGRGTAFIEESVVAQLTSALGGSPAGQARTNMTLTLRGMDGAEVPVRLSTRPLFAGGSGTARSMFIIVDESWRARAQREEERLRSQATLAELRALKAQINPHFFFNTLNTIAHLIETNQNAAVETVEHMAELFRYTLTATKHEQVALRDELDHVRRFLDIERLRHGDNLRVEYSVDERLLDQNIPPMLLQPLVENAIRYGSDELGAVELSIRAEREEGSMLIEIADHGMAEVAAEELLSGDGTGLRNVSLRYSTIFGKPLAFRRNSPRGLIVSMTLPLEEA